MEVDQTNGELNQEYQDIITDQQEKTGKVTKNDFETISVIGKGSYGKVVLVKKKDT